MKITNKDQLKVGTVLVWKQNKNEFLVTGKSGNGDEFFFACEWNDFDDIKKNYTIKDEEIKGASKDLPLYWECRYRTEDNWPQIGDEVWILTGDGGSIFCYWDNTEYQRSVRDFLGIYRTKKELSKARDRIKEVLK